MVAPLSSAMSADLEVSICGPASRDPRAVRILAKTIYRELRQSGLDEQAVMALAGELLSLLASDVQDRRVQSPTAAPPPATGEVERGR